MKQYELIYNSLNLTFLLNLFYICSVLLSSGESGMKYCKFRSMALKLYKPVRFLDSLRLV